MDLKKIRIENGLSQNQFAKTIGVPRSTYQMWEYGKRKPKKQNLILVKKAIKKINQITIEKIINNLQIHDEFLERMSCPKLKYILLLTILALIFTVLY